MLCGLCNNLGQELIDGGSYHHAPSYSALNDSATDGCELCLLLKVTLERGTSIPAALYQDSVFGRALREIGRHEGVWVLWNVDVARGVRVALRRERGGVDGGPVWSIAYVCLSW
jgi:hypothetical protein